MQGWSSPQTRGERWRQRRGSGSPSRFSGPQTASASSVPLPVRNCDDAERGLVPSGSTSHRQSRLGCGDRNGGSGDGAIRPRPNPAGRRRIVPPRPTARASPRPGREPAEARGTPVGAPRPGVRGGGAGGRRNGSRRGTRQRRRQPIRAPPRPSRARRARQHVQHVVGQPGPPPGGCPTASGRISRVFTPFFRMWVQTALEPWPEPGEATIADDPGDGLPVCDTEPFQPGGEQAATRPPRRVQPTRRRLHPGPRLSCPRRYVGPVGRPSIRDPRGPDDPGDHRRLDARSRGVHPPVGLAGLVRPPALGGAVAGRRGPSTGPGPDRLGERPSRHRGMAAGARPVTR